jgi:hypothetical protein
VEPFFHQVVKSHHWMVGQHSGATEAHHASDGFAFFSFVTIYRAVRAEASVHSMIFSAIQRNHEEQCLFFI